MILNMDTELQHLISISVEKMTSGASSSMAGRESRKSGAMDLRKALLVAHFLQEVRQAYLNENYLIVANTFSNYNDADYQETWSSRENHSKKVNQRNKKGDFSLLKETSEDYDRRYCNCFRQKGFKIFCLACCSSSVLISKKCHNRDS